MAAKTFSLFSFSGEMPGKLAGLDLRFEAKAHPDLGSRYGSYRSYAIDPKFFEISKDFKEGRVSVADIKVGRTRYIVAERPTVFAGEAFVELALMKVSPVRGEGATAPYSLSFKTGIINPRTGVIKPYNRADHRGSLYLHTLMPLILEDEEAMGYWSALQEYLKYSFDADELDFCAEEYALKMCNFVTNIYYRDKTGLLPFKAAKEVPLRQDDLALRGAKLTKLCAGKEFDYFVILSAKKDGEEKATAILPFGAYSILTHVLSAIEQVMCVALAPWVIIPQWVETLARDIKDSEIFPQKIRNILLYGPSGTGKTMAARILAYLLGLPYFKLTCGPDTDEFAVIGQMIPNPGKAGEDAPEWEEVLRAADIPTSFDVELDFEGTFEKLFGEKPIEGISTPAECHMEIFRRGMELARVAQNSGDFIYMESDFIKAVRYGGLCEIQEPTVIKKSSVLVSLNAVMETDEDSAFITLPTGEIVHRHPDTVIVMTTNSDYDGCKALQQSVLSRINLSRLVNAPEIDELVERTFSQTNFPDRKKLRKMAKVMVKLNQEALDNEISDGVCGPRELLDWAKKAMILWKRGGEDTICDRDIVGAAFTTILGKVTQTEESRLDMITVFNTEYDADLSMECQAAYEAGEI